MSSNSSLAKYFNYKHPNKPILYKGRCLRNKNDRVAIDVRNFICAHDHQILQFLATHGLNKTWPNDKKAWEIQKLVCGFLRYVGDEQTSGVKEYWQFPYETLHTGTGDCEDGSILIASAMIVLGVPSFRVRVAAGMVQTGNPHAPTGGHAYVCYLRESDNQWVILDWCYLPDKDIPVPQKKLMKDRPEYKMVRFSFNNTHSWANKEFEFNNLSDIPND
jgi:predicted transglutaminase-like cysteine proteinase